MLCNPFPLILNGGPPPIQTRKVFLVLGCTFIATSLLRAFALARAQAFAPAPAASLALAPVPALAFAVAPALPPAFLLTPALALAFALAPVLAPDPANTN